jgi:hypothetical protein
VETVPLASNGTTPPPAATPLTRAFYARSTLEVALDLIG